MLEPDETPQPGLDLEPLGRAPEPPRHSADSSRERLARLVERDGEAMLRRAQELLVERCLLWDAEGLALRALALLAHRQLAERRSRCTEQLRRAALEQALESLAFGPAEDPELAAREIQGLEVFGLPLALGSEAVARACRAHNRATPEQRRAFRGLVIEGRSLDELAHELGWDGGRTARAARELLLKFSQDMLTPDAPPNDLWSDPRSARPATGVRS